MRSCAGRWLFGRLPPVRVPVSKQLLDELMLIGDLSTDAGLILPGTRSQRTASGVASCCCQQVVHARVS